VEGARKGRSDEDLRELLARLVPDFNVPESAPEKALGAVTS